MFLHPCSNFRSLRLETVARDTSTVLNGFQRRSPSNLSKNPARVTAFMVKNSPVLFWKENTAQAVIMAEVSRKRRSGVGFYDRPTAEHQIY
jgi:hypothetical protein